jgi:hypothetical protein
MSELLLEEDAAWTAPTYNKVVITKMRMLIILICGTSQLANFLAPLEVSRRFLTGLVEPFEISKK